MTSSEMPPERLHEAPDHLLHVCQTPLHAETEDTDGRSTLEAVPSLLHMEAQQRFQVLGFGECLAGDLAGELDFVVNGLSLCVRKLWGWRKLEATAIMQSGPTSRVPHEPETHRTVLVRRCTVVAVG